MRARLELFRDLREEHTAWVRRIHAILLHQGVPAIAGDLLGVDNRRRLEAGEQLSAAGRQAVATALRILDALDRSAERRVGEEGRSWWPPDPYKHSSHYNSSPRAIGSP